MKLCIYFVRWFPLFSIPLFFVSAQTIREDIDVIHRGTASAIALHNGIIYLAGDFPGIGTFSTCRAFVDKDSGIVENGWPTVNNEVYVSLSDNNGGWYIGGQFTSVGGLKRGKVAHILADKSINPTFTYEASGQIYALAKLGDTLFIGGYFPEGLIAVNVKTNKRVPNWTPKFPGNEQFIQNLILYDTLLCVLGEFTTVNGLFRNHFALLNSKNGMLLPQTQNDIMFPYRVLFKDSMMITNTYILDNMGNPHRSIIAKNIWNDSIYWKLPYSGNIYAYGMYDSALYVSGEHLSFGDSLKDIVSINVMNGTFYSWKAVEHHSWTRMAVTPDQILGTYYDTTFSLNRMTGEKTIWNPDPDNIVHTLNYDGSRVFLGGEFTSMNPKPRKGFAAIDEATGKVMSSAHSVRSAMGFPNYYPLVSSMKVSDSILYLVGSFDSVNSERRNRFAAINILNNRLLPLLIEMNDSLVWNKFISTIEIIDSVVVIGGTFTKINGQKRKNLAAFSSNTGILLNWSPDPNQSVSVLKNINGTLYVGGKFDTINGSKRYGLASFNNFQLLDWKPRILLDTLNGFTGDMIEWNSALYITGSFTQINSLPRNNLAAFDLQTGLLTPWNPDGGPGVRFLSSTKDAIIALEAAQINGYRQNGMFALDPFDGTVFQNWDPFPTLGVGPGISSNKYFYVTGTFMQIGPIPYNNRRVRGFAGVSLPLLTSVKYREVQKVGSFSLDQNYPNPFNPTTSIKFVVGGKSHVTLKVYDVMGRELQTLLNEEKDVGSYRIPFNGSTLASGMYFYRLQYRNGQQTKKMLIVK